MIWDGDMAQVLEVNVSPGMTENSLLPMAVRSAYSDPGLFLEQLLDKAVARGKSGSVSPKSRKQA
jgi:D-alanine-D-alanine ligase